VDANALYNTLSTRVIGDLVGLAMAIGIAAVAFVYIRRAITDTEWIRSDDLWRHIALMFSITLFFVYIDVAYEVEFYKGEIDNSSNDLIQAEDFANSVFLPRIRLLLLLPIDLVGIGLMSSLFGVLVVFGSNQTFSTGPSVSTSLEVVYLLTLTSAWHAAMIGWWLVYGLTDNNVQNVTWDMGMNAGFASIELLLAIIITKLRNSEWGIRNSNLLAWVATIAYSLILMGIYSIRLWDYSFRFINIIIY